MNKSTTFAIIAIIILGALFLLMQQRSDSEVMGTENTAVETREPAMQEFIIHNRPIDLPNTVAVNLVQKAQVGSFNNPEWAIAASDGGTIRWGGVWAENCASLRVAMQGTVVDCIDTEKGALYILESESSVEAQALFDVTVAQL
jgi:hypothetical protein